MKFHLKTKQGGQLNDNALKNLYPGDSLTLVDDERGSEVVATLDLIEPPLTVDAETQRRAMQKLATKEYVFLLPNRSTLDGEFSAAELRQIADVMDELKHQEATE